MARGVRGRRVKLEIENLPELRRALRELGTDAARQTLQQPLRKASEIIRRDAAARAPVSEVHRRGSGRERRLKNSITVEADFRQLEKGRIAFLIGPTAFYGLFQELGWMPRGPGNRATSRERAAREAGQGGKFYKARFRGVGRGGSRGQPFLRPAFDAKKSRAIYMAQEGIRKRIDYVVRKHRLGRVA